MTVAASFGLASALSVVVLGDESGYAATEHQKMKLAAIEAMWHTEPAPADFTLFAIPDIENRKNDYAIVIPYALGLIATRSISTEVPGILNLVKKAKTNVELGLKAYAALQVVRKNPNNKEALAQLRRYDKVLGYAFLLKKYRPDIQNATSQEITKAANDTIPNVLLLFWSFRLMVAMGFFFIALFGLFFYFSAKRTFEKHPLFLRIAAISLPLPWIAGELGWVVAENGRQPWVVEGILPTSMGVSSVSYGQVMFSLVGFIVFYSLLAVVDLYLMVKYVKLGPDKYFGHSTDAVARREADTSLHIQARPARKGV